MRHPMLVMERAVLLKTGSLARAFESYPLPYIQALLLYGDEASKELETIASPEEIELDWLFQDVHAKPTQRSRPTARRPRVQGAPKKHLPTPTSYDEPMFTGDPVADEWERAIARGEIPDLNAHMADPDG